MKMAVQICVLLQLVTSNLWAADVQNNADQQVQVTRNLISMPLAFAESQ